MTELPAKPAATLILMRPASGAPEMLMVRRTRNMAFAAGAWVWPGGRVDPDDVKKGEGHALEDAAFRIAAIRETHEEVGIDLGEDLSQLTPLARWLPKFNVERRFDTMFYIARAPDGARIEHLQEGEIADACWTSAAAMLARIDNGDATAIFPTKRNLERLARYASIEEAIADAGRYPLDPITPWVEERDGEDHVVIADDIGYPVTSEPLTSAIRA